MNHDTFEERLDVIIDGYTMTPELLTAIGYRNQVRLQLDQDALQRCIRARKVIDDVVAEGRVVYGINTGFGKFASTVVGKEDIEQLQVNLIRSHSAGVGDPLPPNRARMMLALRINVLARGNSGIRPETLKIMIDAFNAGFVPYVPRVGTVGASGDLAPLSHQALGLMGEGRAASLENPTWRDAKLVMSELKVPCIVLKAKEGLALINGTQFMTSLACEAIVRAINLCRVADVVTALTVEALLGTKMAFQAHIHKARGHSGQMQSAARIRGLLTSERFPSEIAASHVNCNRVQDAYSMRCAPQVHGIAVETVRWVEDILRKETNSSTDNPLIFPEEKDPKMQIISGGNFHGEFPAKALDYLAIGVHELGNISERRIERLNNPSLSHLPAFLTSTGGKSSGFMIAHCTAAALVSENKIFCHPASIDSISTSAAQEDHVSMGGAAARKVLRVIENVERVLAIELMCAAQGIEFHRPLKTTGPLEAVVSAIRKVCPSWKEDRDVSVDIANIAELIRTGHIWDIVRPFLPHDLWTCLGGQVPMAKAPSKF
jgi:histidine ammonia-lyase